MKMDDKVKLIIFMIFLSSFTFLAMGFAQMTVQLVCLSIDIDHSKFQPRREMRSLSPLLSFTIDFVV